jgi:hypothetical protein
VNVREFPVIGNRKKVKKGTDEGSSGKQQEDQDR